jgi:hypothetical protein
MNGYNSASIEKAGGTAVFMIAFGRTFTIITEDWDNWGG